MNSKSSYLRAVDRLKNREAILQSSPIKTVNFLTIDARDDDIVPDNESLKVLVELSDIHNGISIVDSFFGLPHKRIVRDIESISQTYFIRKPLESRKHYFERIFNYARRWSIHPHIHFTRTERIYPRRIFSDSEFIKTNARNHSSCYGHYALLFGSIGLVFKYTESETRKIGTRIQTLEELYWSDSLRRDSNAELQINRDVVGEYDTLSYEGFLLFQDDRKIIYEEGVGEQIPEKLRRYKTINVVVE